MVTERVLALQAVTPDALARSLHIDLAEARKIIAAVHRGEWRGATRMGDGAGLPAFALAGVRRVAMEAARAGGEVPSLDVRSIQPSAIDPFVKIALGTPDGYVVEAVRIPLERAGRFSACVSSQAGCALACAFCATGRLGLGRNLATWEMVEQVRAVKRTTVRGQRVHGVVFQGMGEPLSNVDRVLEAIAVITEPCALAIDARAITVCTAGLPAGIRKLAREAPKVRLGWSIASARRDVRRTLMPIDDIHSLDDVLASVEEHALVTGLAPMWAVTPLSGVNDTDEDARALVALAKRFEARAGMRPRVSIIPYNAIDEVGHDPFERGNVRAFIDRIVAHGLRPHLRYSGGGDVGAACGQLAGRDRGERTPLVGCSS